MSFNVIFVPWARTLPWKSFVELERLIFPEAMRSTVFATTMLLPTAWVMVPLETFTVMLLAESWPMIKDWA